MTQQFKSTTQQNYPLSMNVALFCRDSCYLAFLGLCPWSLNNTNPSNYVYITYIYTLVDPWIYYYSYYGSGYGPVVWGYVYCGGWERNIHDCSKSIYPSFTCYSNYVAGVLCKESQLISYIHMQVHTIYCHIIKDVKMVM